MFRSRPAAELRPHPSELIREGVRKVISETEAQPRSFRSLAAGRGGGGKAVGWTSEALYRKAMGQR